MGEEFGRTVPGIFTDEPSIRGFQEQLNEPELPWITWSDLLPQTFSDRNGYEIWDTLPYFFFLGPFSSKIRHDYWKTVTEMFCDAYTKQIGNWCAINGLSFAWHFCDEGDIVGAVRHCGAVMPHYRYMDVPGIDTLCEQTDESLTIKQVSSVANQYGKKKVITETYGVKETVLPEAALTAPDRAGIAESVPIDFSLRNVTDIASEKVTFHYNTQLFDFVSVNSAQAGITVTNTVYDQANGAVSVNVSNTGFGSGTISGSQKMLRLMLRAKSASGIGSVEVTSAQMTDSTGMVTDINGLPGKTISVHTVTRQLMQP
ncbi:hypothetical protein HQN89_34620 [Paenibacillus frigoriresistens]|uniref:cohesin domain-containing protein n=1 Tax=Paenibacillus alginolyticus TaxID=59839 RepID=UPI0015648E1A|nr:cohesin domain-containing protein [Paenibacillus frigoriresistens]NRF95944.1 hypothetical protein [Paenibacillus frigoriresistens]